MFTGLKEVLVIVVVLAGLFILPRMLGRRAKAGPGPARSPKSTTSKPGLMRLAVFLSVLWIAIALVLLKPFDGNWMPFVLGGILPVTICWGVRWVVLGFR